ncbi:MAG: replication initiator protein [Microvirus sp.]|nr:MAG: replication initiator protein [Microvirus sp.]
MPCYYPIPCWKPRDWSQYDPKTGKAPMVFREDLGFPNTKTLIPCGQCIGCRLARALDWSVRCIHEASQHEKTCFLTLTYSRDNLPEGGSLNKTDIQKFFKRLRKAHEELQIRYFQCGEYGDKLHRPHHHVLLFGYDFPDKLPYKFKGNDNIIYVSKELSQLWPLGIHAIGELNQQSASYTCRYILKKQTGEPAEAHYQGRLPEFTTMSRRPGIGKTWFDQFKSDLFSHDRCVIRHGFVIPPPDYYDRLYELEEPHHLKDLKKSRRSRAKEKEADNTYERLETKKTIVELKQTRRTRLFETAPESQLDNLLTATYLQHATKPAP